MLTIFVFDEHGSRREEDLPEALRGLDDDAMLWVALCDPTAEEATVVQEALKLSDEEGEPVLRPLECVLGANWVVTAHEAEIEVLEEFRARAEGGGQVGA